MGDDEEGPSLRRPIKAPFLQWAHEFAKTSLSLSAPGKLAKSALRISLCEKGFGEISRYGKVVGSMYYILVHYVAFVLCSNVPIFCSGRDARRERERERQKFNSDFPGPTNDT